MCKVFISHSSKDKPFVRKLKEDLNFNEIETWLDEDELKVGDRLYESLILGLTSSTHFLIVLSNNIKGSEWVEAEINEAISSFKKNILKKIIPVVLRKTEIPDALSELFRADFSSIIFTINGDKVQSVGNEYHKELEKIVMAIKQSNEYILSNSEKRIIMEETDKQLDKGSVEKQHKIVGLYEIIGFTNNASRIDYIKSVKNKFKKAPINKIANESISPVVLPNLLKPLFDKLLIGEKIFFPVDNKENLEAHFCGFSKNNLRIIIPSEIRKVFGIKPKEVVTLEVDGKERSIKFID